MYIPFLLFRGQPYGESGDNARQLGGVVEENTYTTGLPGAHKPTEYALLVFVRMILDPSYDPGVAQAGRYSLYLCGVLHVRLARLSYGL
jgi:hypothetical protein